MPQRPTVKSSYLTEIHLQENFFSTRLNQFTAVSSFYLVNTDIWNFMRIRGVLHIHQGQSFISGFHLCWKKKRSLSDVISVRQKHARCRCPPPDRKRYEGELRAYSCTPICVLIWICAEKHPLWYFCTCPVPQSHNLIQEFPKVKHERMERVGLLSWWITGTVMASTCSDKTSNSPHSRWPQRPAPVPLCAQSQQCK